MKKRTLNQTWVLCLRMWRSIAKKWDADTGENAWPLKYLWLKENGFNPQTIRGACFFCDFAELDCKTCPGTLVTSSFVCTNEDYDYETKPVEFYTELLRLNRIRKEKK